MAGHINGRNELIKFPIQIRVGCAILSAAVYQYGRPTQNRVPPTSAIELIHTTEIKTGFEASAYNYQGKTVIAFAGTDVSQKADLWADATLGAGSFSPQIYQAAMFYYDVKAKYGDNIVFTGHSLGGGLASLMAVFFDKPAVTFDPAPFRLAAVKENAEDLLEFLKISPKYAPLAYSDVALNNYSTTESILGTEIPGLAPALIAAGLINNTFAKKLVLKKYPTVIPRESNVTAYAVSGEFLTNGYQGIGASLENALRIKSTPQSNLIDINPSAVSGMELHSQALLIAAATAPELVEIIKKMPAVAVNFFDAKIYKHESNTPDEDFLNRLVKQEYGTSVASSGFIQKFAADLKVLTAIEGDNTQKAFQNALIVAAMDYYHERNAANATKLFTLSGDSINFTFDDIGNDQSKFKSRPKLANAVWNVAEEDEVAARVAALAANAWHIQAGSGTLTWTGSDNVNDAAIGGAGADTEDGGAGNDLLMGLDGADNLKGGTGNDLLIGGDGADQLTVVTVPMSCVAGAGSDTYLFTGASFGSDTILDSDGQGRITVDGLTLSGGKKVQDMSMSTKPPIWASHSMTPASPPVAVQTFGFTRAGINGEDVFHGNMSPDQVLQYSTFKSNDSLPGHANDTSLAIGEVVRSSAATLPTAT